MVESKPVNKILFITLSNLGDAVMSLPAFDFLRRECPESRITVVASERTRPIFENRPEVNELIIFNKKASIKEKIKLFFLLQRKGFDVIVDLKNTFYRFGLKAKRKNPAVIKYPSWVRHDSQKHLYQAVVALKGHEVDEATFKEYNTRRNPSFITSEDKEYMRLELSANNVGSDDEFILFVPGARSELKRWDKNGFMEVGREIVKKYGYKIVIAGSREEVGLAEEIRAGIGDKAVVFCGRTTFGQLSALVESSKIILGNDSGALHVASYLDKLIVGIYGPSDHLRYGPWSKRGFVVRKNLLCSPCGNARCHKNKECIKTVTPYDVLLAVRLILEGNEGRLREAKYSRILIARTDRIGDVLLSTPVIRALRDHYPASFIAMMVAPNTSQIVEGNPYLDEVIVFDKDKTNGLIATLSFARRLKREKFDAVVVLHPTLRVHLIMFLAGIRERIGYARKAPYFLTTAVPHYKQEGRKHEVEYNFDLLRSLGISGVNKKLYMPIRSASERFVEKMLVEAGLAKDDILIAVNPSASCISKIWPLEKFAKVIDRLQSIPKLKVLISADSAHAHLSEELLSLTKSMPLDFSGRFDLSCLASLFKRVKLVISNDSGPVHLAVAVGTPVISIFGRNQPGLGPKRWGPLGERDIVLHKKTGCEPCLAHACLNNFKCLEGTSVEEVVSAALKILKISMNLKS